MSRRRAEAAAAANRRLALQAEQKSEVARAWKKSEQTLPRAAPKENFFGYENASMREFGGYEEEEIYDSVPPWFVGKLDRKMHPPLLTQCLFEVYLFRQCGLSLTSVVLIRISPAFVLAGETCDKAIIKGGPGTYAIRESSGGDKYIVCINWNGVAKNFQIFITDNGSYKFSGQTYVC